MTSFLALDPWVWLGLAGTGTGSADRRPGLDGTGSWQCRPRAGTETGIAGQRPGLQSPVWHCVWLGGEPSRPLPTRVAPTPFGRSAPRGCVRCADKVGVFGRTMLHTEPSCARRRSAHRIPRSQATGRSKATGCRGPGGAPEPSRDGATSSSGRPPAWWQLHLCRSACSCHRPWP